MGIDYIKPLKNLADAMSRKDAPEWMEAYRKKFQGFKDRDSVGMVIPPRGAKVLGSTTRVDYKVEQGVLQKRKYVCAHEGISKSMVLTTAILGIKSHRSQINDCDRCRTRLQYLLVTKPILSRLSCIVILK